MLSTTVQAHDLVAEIKAEGVDPLQADLASLWFTESAQKRKKLEALAHRAEVDIAAANEAYEARTGRSAMPLSAPEYAEKTAYDRRLLAHIELLRASRNIDTYRRAKAHALARLAALEQAARARAEAAARAAQGRSELAQALRYRATLDQAWREMEPNGAAPGANGDAPLSDAGQAFFRRLFRLEWGRVDLDNARWLKAQVQAVGWPRPSVEGLDTYIDAWTIVQHAVHDRAFQEDALGRMRTLLAQGEGDGRYVALLADRLAIFSGKKQVYGTQFRCHDHKIVPAPIAEPASVDARRKAVGLKPLSESSLIGKAC